ncbi:MAG: ATP-binding cassette domain-containing protein [Pseudomonadota bacterium]
MAAPRITLPALPPAPVEPCQSKQAVIAALGVVKHYAGKPVLGGASAVFRRGELTAILGRRGSGRTTLAAVLAGQRLPDAGRVWYGGRIAPLIGHSAAFGATGNIRRDLGLRAAAAGLNGRRFAEAVAAEIGDPAVLDRSFERLEGPARAALCHAAAWLVPADVYIADGGLVPSSGPGAGALAERLAARRKDAAVVWLTAGVTSLRAMAPDRLLLLENGLLRPLADIEEAIALFDEKRRKKPARPTKAADTPDRKPFPVPKPVAARIAAPSAATSATPGAAEPAAQPSRTIAPVAHKAAEAAAAAAPGSQSGRARPKREAAPAPSRGLSVPHPKPPSADTRRPAPTPVLSAGTVLRLGPEDMAETAPAGMAKAARSAPVRPAVVTHPLKPALPPAYRTLFKGRRPRPATVEGEPSSQAEAPGTAAPRATDLRPNAGKPHRALTVSAAPPGAPGP